MNLIAFGRSCKLAMESFTSSVIDNGAKQGRLHCRIKGVWSILPTPWDNIEGEACPIAGAYN